MRNKYTILTLVFTTVSMIFGFIYYFFMSEKKIETLAEQNVLNVKKIQVDGTIQPENQTVVQADLTGEILEMFVKEGDSVIKSQILFNILPDKETSVLSNLQSKLDEAKSDLAKIKTNLEDTKSEFVAAKQKADRAKMAELQTKLNDFATTLNKARLNVIKTENLLKDSKQKLVAVNVLANTNGIVSEIKLPKGTKILENSEQVLVISDLQTLEIFCKVKQKNLLNLAVGDSAKIEVENLENKKISGFLRQILLKNDSFEIKIRILDQYLKKYPLKVGNKAKIEISKY